jgi:4-hydroxy-2-oxoheptanedioate aldolase
MPENRFKQKLAEGAKPLMVWMWNPSVLFAEIMCAADFDAVGIDLQHGAVDFNDLYGIMAVVSANGATPIVRIPAPDDLGWVTRVLDGGARGVICPNVDTPEQAAAFARAAKYPPVGQRGFGPVRPGIGKAVGYQGGPDAYSLADENDAVLTIVQIESAEGLENVEAIVNTCPRNASASRCSGSSTCRTRPEGPSACHRSHTRTSGCSARWARTGSRSATTSPG